MNLAKEAFAPLRASLHHLVIGSPDPTALAGFYAGAMGLELVSGEDRLLAAGPDRRLQFVEGHKKSLNLAGYAVEAASDITVIRRRCAALGVAVYDHADPMFQPGAILVVDPDGNRIAFGLGRDTTASGQGVKDGLTARLQHVVVASPDAAALSRFYQEAFGFLVSDEVFDEAGALRTTFLRCSSEHHSFAVFQAHEAWFDHHCYEAGDWGLIRDWGDRFASLDLPIQWGPGRHGPGNNLFLFIHDLDGNWLEISAELEIVAPDRPAGVWRHEQKTLNKWGSAPLRS
jgi:catechol 2,3-dioxygenase-like lactoylglutathione lyase family enzyme